MDIRLKNKGLKTKERGPLKKYLIINSVFVLRLMSYVLCLTSYVLCLTSYVLRLFVLSHKIKTTPKFEQICLKIKS